MCANSFLLLALLLIGAVLAEHHGDHGEDGQSGNSTDDDLYNPRDALLKYLLARASPRVPPPPRYLPIKVQVKLRPLSIRSVCTKTYHIDVPTLEMYNWTDPRLAWNSSDFGGVEYIDVSAKDIWMPDIAVWQSPASTPMQTRPKEYKAVITSDGSVLYIPISELSIYCDAAPWKRHDRSNNNGQQKSKSRNRRQSESGGDNETESGWSQDEGGYKTYDCEFDQGPWIYDLSVVDVIPVSTGTAFHEHIEGQNETSSTEESNEEEQNQQQDEEQTDEETDPHGNKKVSQRQEYPADDYDATADLSWFDGNEEYDIASFTAERLVERYTSFPVDWASIHYHLIVKVNNDAKPSSKSKKNKKLSPSSRSGASGRRGAASSNRQEKKAEEEPDTDDEDEKKSSDNDD